MRRLIALTVVFLAMPVMAGACGVSQSSDFEQISGDDIQFDLDETTTTSTTTIPPTTVDATSTTLAQTTTTEIPTELVELYYVAGSQLNPVSVPLTSPVSPQRALTALQEADLGALGLGLRTTIPADAEITVTRERGTAIIDLPPDIFDSMPTRDQKLFFAQLVLTIGQLGGIGPVLFSTAGEPSTAVRGDTTVAEAGVPVTIDDYQNLLPGAVAVTTTTTTAPPPPETATGSTIGG
jgi:hypothetical protein